MQPEHNHIPETSHNIRSLNFRIPINSVQIPDDLRSWFWSSVDRTATYWLWTGALSAHGYGFASISGVSAPAHRWAWVLTYGSIPALQAGLRVKHSADESVRTICLMDLSLWSASVSAFAMVTDR